MMSISVIFENQDIIVVNKPAGLGVHQEGDCNGIVTLLQKQLNVPQLWLAHRLDKVTSGLLLLAKSAEAAARLGELFTQRKIQKYYFAISDRKSNKKQGSVIGDMRTLRDGKWALSKTFENPAISQFFSCGMGNGLRFYVIKPHTGKTHQIRVMMKSLSSPILGDNLYTGKASDRTYLHAYMLQFSDQGNDYIFSSLPQTGIHFQSLLNSQITHEFFTPQQLNWPTLKYQQMKRTGTFDG
ncbi:TIGR01621 family pseudouridine synthase [Aliiglaciecola litoralis]|uniref:RNA pseudouridine synthase n=1 Tax=Aliiglaciecola litoralis TaxID=582857 RepID=A0ABN1LLM6_9ALTE